jgi:hypothetical protein
VERAHKIAAVLLLAVAVPATAHTFGFSLGVSARAVCLSIGDTTYRVASAGARADYTVRIDPNAPAPDVRINHATAPDEADFVLVDEGPTPANCAARGGPSMKTVRISTDADAPDLVVGLAAAAGADYRIYVRSERITPEAAAALFAVARKSVSRVAAGR